MRIRKTIELEYTVPTWIIPVLHCVLHYNDELGLTEHEREKIEQFLETIEYDLRNYSVSHCTFETVEDSECEQSWNDITSEYDNCVILKVTAFLKGNEQ